MTDRQHSAVLSSLGMALALVMLAGLAGCGNGDEDTTDTSDAASNGTVTDSDASGSGGSTDDNTGDTDPDAGSSGSTNELADGSGCTPGTETGLPDGRWYGRIEVTDDRRVDFDLACWFSGDAAVTAAAEDGEESPPPNDYYVRNVNPLVRTLEVAAGTMVSWYPDIGNPESVETVTFDEWVTGLGAREGRLGVWIETQDGVITAIEEQWVP